MHSFDKQQTPNTSLALFEILRTPQWKKPEKNRQANKQKLSSRSLITKWAKKVKLAPWRQPHLLQRHREHRSCSDTAVSWPWRVSRKGRTGRTADQEANSRDLWDNRVWGKRHRDLLWQEIQGGKARGTLSERWEARSKRELGKMTLSLPRNMTAALPWPVFSQGQGNKMLPALYLTEFSFYIWLINK